MPFAKKVGASRSLAQGHACFLRLHVRHQVIIYRQNDTFTTAMKTKIEEHALSLSSFDL